MTPENSTACIVICMGCVILSQLHYDNAKRKNHLLGQIGWSIFGVLQLAGVVYYIVAGAW